MNKEAYIQYIESKIDETDARIDLLQAKMQRMDSQTKMSYQQELNDLEEQRDFLKENLILMRQASDSTWERVKGDFESKWEQIKAKIDSMAEKM